jgi:Transposase DDE domain group 1
MPEPEIAKAVQLLDLILEHFADDGCWTRGCYDDGNDYASFGYQAQSRKKSRRVVAKVEWHPGELYPRVGFIVTNLARPAERVVAFYNQRGTAEQCIKKARAQSSGGDCHAARSPPTPCVFSSTPSRTTSAISCGRWRCPRWRSRGH